jgi:hypothetical protein
VTNWLKRGMCAALVLLGASLMAERSEAHGGYGRHQNYPGNYYGGYGQGRYRGYGYGNPYRGGYGGYHSAYRGYYSGYAPRHYSGYGYCR